MAALARQVHFPLDGMLLDPQRPMATLALSDCDPAFPRGGRLQGFARLLDRRCYLVCLLKALSGNKLLRRWAAPAMGIQERN